MITSLISSNNEKLTGLQKSFIPFLESLPKELCDNGQSLNLTRPQHFHVEMRKK